MWKDLSKQWQTVFEGVWDAFVEGSVPIGAAVYDDHGNLLVADRNRAKGPETINRKISHAEANVLRNLNIDGLDAHRLVLYTSMEPCPMCMGTFVMSGIRNVKSAAADPYCGAMHILDTDSYLKDKHVAYELMRGEHELFSLAVHDYYEKRRIDTWYGSDRVLKCFAEWNPKAFEIASKLYEKRTLEEWKDKKVSEVYDLIVSMSGIF